MDIKNLCLGCMADKGESERCPYCGWSDADSIDTGQHIPPGTILQGKYLLGRVLGQGGFGITYLAWDLDLNIKLAIKEYLPRDFATRTLGETAVSVYPGDASGFFEEGREKFLEEARTLARFEEHPNIVSVRDFFRENQTAYFVMNYIEGVTLKEYVKQHGDKVDFTTALSVMLPVMDALAEVHDQNILHRDISPDNIFITEKGIVKLLDFGAARQAIGEHSKSLSVILKPGYAPEEQYRSRGNQGPWTDVYATAATFYRVLCGQVPPDSLDRMAGEELIAPSQMGVIIPPESEAALLKALSINAAARFQNMREFQQALTGRAYEPLKDRAAPAGTASRAEGQSRGGDKPTPRMLVAGVIAMLLSLMAIGGWWAFSSQQTGSGTYIFADGRIYTGPLKGGLPDGHGVVQVSSLGQYEGEWKAGVESGQQTFTYTNGNRYVGEMKDGQQSGQGTMTQTNGTNYTGSWKAGKMDGQGVLKAANGSIYEGEWKDGLQNGQGKFTFADGNVYTGAFQAGSMTGKGSFKYTDGATYSGDVKNGKRDGQGVYVWPNGDRYEGSFVEDRKDGRGRLIRADGTIEEGFWKYDVLVR